MVASEIEYKVTNRINELFDVAKNSMGTRLVKPSIKICPSSVMRSTSGIAYLESNIVAFNSDFLNNHTDEFIKQTVAHELAHIIVFQTKGIIYSVNGRRVSHGTDWKNVMYLFGVEPKRCHNYDVTVKRRKVKRYNYVCTACGKDISISSIRHNRIVANKAVYTHTCPQKGNITLK